MFGFAAVCICRICQGFQFFLFNFHSVWNLCAKRSHPSTDSPSCYRVFVFPLIWFQTGFMLMTANLGIFQKNFLRPPCRFFHPLCPAVFSTIQNSGSQTSVSIQLTWAACYNTDGGPLPWEVSVQMEGVAWESALLIGSQVMLVAVVYSSASQSGSGDPWVSPRLFHGVPTCNTVFIIILICLSHLILFHKYTVVCSRISRKWAVLISNTVNIQRWIIQTKVLGSPQSCFKSIKFENYW